MKQIADEIGPVNRLVVLVPEQILSEGRMARQIWQLAQAHQSSLLLVARIEAPDQEMTARRHLATLASLLEDVWHKVEIKVVSAKNWCLALENLVRPGDLLVCHAEQEVSHKPLSIALQNQFNLPVQVLSGFSLKESHSNTRGHLKTAIIIGCFLLTMVGFFVFEIRIDQLVKGTVGQIILILVLLIEYGLFWLLNNLAN